MEEGRKVNVDVVVKSVLKIGSKLALLLLDDISCGPLLSLQLGTTTVTLRCKVTGEMKLRYKVFTSAGHIYPVVRPHTYDVSPRAAVFLNTILSLP